MQRQYVEKVQVYRLEPRGPRAVLVAGNLVIPCLIGRNGARADKREGDGCSPIAPMRILGGFWRRDRRLPPRTGIALRPIRPNDGWCDAPGHPCYNHLIQKPFSASHEEMMRADHQYDVVLDLDWNRAVRRQGRGSAIFLHIRSERTTGSAGCITLPARRIDCLLSRLGPKTFIHIR